MMAESFSTIYNPTDHVSINHIVEDLELILRVLPRMIREA